MGEGGAFSQQGGRGVGGGLARDALEKKLVKFSDFLILKGLCGGVDQTMSSLYTVENIFKVQLLWH